MNPTCYRLHYSAVRLRIVRKPHEVRFSLVAFLAFPDFAQAFGQDAIKTIRESRGLTNRLPFMPTEELLQPSHQPHI